MPRSKKRKPKPTSARKAPNVTLELAEMVPHLREEFLRKAGPTKIDLLHPKPQLLHDRVQSTIRTIRSILPARVVARIVITADFTQTISQLRHGAAYTTGRGANEAVAKTIPASDGSFDIVLDATLFVSPPEHTEADLAEQSAILAHLAAHEPQHVLMQLDKTDSSFYVDDVEQSEGRMYRALAAEALNEFRCELAAGRIHPNSTETRREDSISEDLGHLRKSLNESLQLCSTDTGQASFIAFTAIKEFLKALAYFAAERIAEGRSSEPPKPTPEEGWDHYGESLWTQVFEVFAETPAADEPSSQDYLLQKLTRLCDVLAVWVVDTVGIRYEIHEDGSHSCWWERESY